MDIYIIDNSQLYKFIDRYRKPDNIILDPKLDILFKEILVVANKFVPSEAGSILLDDPAVKLKNALEKKGIEENELVFIASFGEKASHLPGTRIKAGQGITGKTYITGKSYISQDVQKDENFYKGIDTLTSYSTHSVICVPIILENSVCGVLELINRKSKHSFEQRELELLEIFAGYISVTMQNILEANNTREMAKRDHLTNLYNSRYLLEKISEEIENSEKEQTELSMIFFDLDNFKSINDLHGHLAGSQTLKEVGKIISKIVVINEATVARYGGDEFVILLPKLNINEAYKLAEVIRQSIEEYTFLSTPTFDIPPLNIKGMITASIGVVSYKGCNFENKTLEKKKTEFIKKADEAMYKAKSLGKNRVLVSSD